MRPEFIRSHSSAGPYLSFGIAACLIRFRRINAFQPDVGVGYNDRVAIDDPRLAYDGCLLLCIPVLGCIETEQTSHKNDPDE
jgi:hypothetical protein